MMKNRNRQLEIKKIHDKKKLEHYFFSLSEINYD